MQKECERVYDDNSICTTTKCVVQFPMGDVPGGVSLENESHYGLKVMPMECGL